MRSISRFLSIAVLSIALVSGCAALTGKTTGTNIDDATITTSVKTNLASERGMQTLTAVDVDTNRGLCLSMEQLRALLRKAAQPKSPGKRVESKR